MSRVAAVTWHEIDKYSKNKLDSQKVNISLTIHSPSSSFGLEGRSGGNLFHCDLQGLESLRRSKLWRIIQKIIACSWAETRILVSLLSWNNDRWQTFTNLTFNKKNHLNLILPRLKSFECPPLLSRTLSTIRGKGSPMDWTSLPALAAVSWIIIH